MVKTLRFHYSYFSFYKLLCFDRRPMTGDRSLEIIVEWYLFSSTAITFRLSTSWRKSFVVI
jgi:aminoglycoside/choline kinase family phosphotransferase